MRYFEDVEVGVAHEIGEHCVSREEIVRFASEWDPQPFHLDEEQATQSVFGGLTASSCHTYAISSLIFSKNPDRMAVAAMLGLSLRFPTAVRPGDELRQLDECIEKRLSRSRPGLGVVQSRTTLTNRAGQEVFVMESSYLVRCRP
ncbi:MAG: acyl dehydratase [Deltaproteobacteria bacterium]|nr:acyl dehydratase [Deltaproteobacteria bacterium]